MSSCCFIFGYGYTAQALAPKLIAQGFQVIGTSRSPDKSTQNNTNVKLIAFDSPDIENDLGLATHLLICIPPNSTSCDIVLSQYRDLIQKQAPLLNWIGYLSSTGVYGNHKDDWVNEESLCIPHTPSGIARLTAEQHWLSFAQEQNLPLHLFRLSGIYGPRRNALERLINGKKYSIYKENQVFSRIHVDDITTTLLASIQLPKPLSIYNVSDDEPAPAHLVDLFATKLLHKEPLPLLPFSEARLSPMEEAFYSNNRRISNFKIKKELNVVLKYPNYIEGLTQIWRDDYAPK